ncbi:zinc metalloprotease [Aureivirga sp. CE67]|uniref:zinc metalloprotease n=1 Tax=Aureivirga sp. CE67 TaxID=1788983 RepID=UPI0018CAFF27|nr:zinc metalloprotease [Aureivirga sp. CE67]
MTKAKWLVLTLCMLVLVSCEDEQKDEIALPEQTEETVEHRNCLTTEVLEKEASEDPTILQRMNAIEDFTQNYRKRERSESERNSLIYVPVVVHVVYSNYTQNISYDQIQSQINVLNRDFNLLNDVSSIPSEFRDDAAAFNMYFYLEQIIRVPSNRASWGDSSDIKHSNRGGSDAWDTSRYLNIWVGNIGGGILGYAQFPGGNPDTDGVVVSPQFFGTTGYVQAPFNLGRTTTHEVGHWLNLRHIWGDSRNCSIDDFVYDTPSQNTPNYGCPNYPTYHCNTSDMFMNFMDYTDDYCMSMFTKGQKQRSRALFANGGAREGFVR